MRIARMAGTRHAAMDTMVTRATISAGYLRDVLTNVTSQHFIDKRLIPDAPPPRFLAELIEHTCIDADRDQLTRLIAERRAPDAPHGLQLRCR